MNRQKYFQEIVLAEERHCMRLLIDNLFSRICKGKIKSSSYREFTYVFGNLRVTLLSTNYDIDRHFRTPNDPRNRTEHDCTCRTISISGHYDHRNCRIYFPVELLFTYVDNAPFLLHDRSKLRLFHSINATTSNFCM